MFESSRQLGFAQESAAAVSIVGKPRLDFLERDCAIELLIAPRNTLPMPPLTCRLIDRKRPASARA